MRLGPRRTHPPSVGIAQRKRMMHDNVLFAVSIEIGQPGVLLVVGHFDLHRLGMPGEEFRARHSGECAQRPGGGFDQQVRVTVAGHISDEQSPVERAPISVLGPAALVQPPAEHDVQWHPPRLPVAGGAVQVDPADGIGGVAEGTPLHAVELEVQPRVIAHAPLEPLEEAAPERPDLDGREHQFGLAVAIEVVTVHPELNAAGRKKRDAGTRCELRPAVGCSRPRIHLVSGLLAGDARALQHQDREVADAIAVHVG